MTIGFTVFDENVANSIKWAICGTCQTMAKVIKSNGVFSISISDDNQRDKARIAAESVAMALDAKYNILN